MAGILLPVGIHFCVLNMIYMMRLHMDAASLTTMAALISLPVFLSMYKKDRERYGQEGWGCQLPSIMQMFILAGLALISNLFLTGLMNMLIQIFHLRSLVQEALFGSSFLIQLVGVGIICPVMEEVLFRGLVYRRLKAYNEGWFAVFMAAAFFAVYHENAIQIIFAFPMAIVIIGVYERFGTLFAPILFHIIVNLSSVLVNRMM